MITQTFNIALPKELVKRVDATAKKEYRNRSELIREALRVYLQSQEEWSDLSAYGKAKTKTICITNEEKVASIVSDYRHGK